MTNALNTQHKDGRTSIHIAAMSNNIKCIKQNIHATDINIEDKWNMTALMYAVINNDVDIVKLLLENGANTDATFKLSKERKIYRRPCRTEYSHDLSYDNACTRYNNTPLFTLLSYSILKGNLAVATLLLNSNKLTIQNINQLVSMNTNHNDKTSTALHLAIEQKQADIALSLLKQGASCTAQDSNGNTPLHIIAKISDFGQLTHTFRDILLQYTTEEQRKEEEQRKQEEKIHFYRKLPYKTLYSFGVLTLGGTVTLIALYSQVHKLQNLPTLITTCVSALVAVTLMGIAGYKHGKYQELLPLQEKSSNKENYLPPSYEESTKQSTHTAPKYVAGYILLSSPLIGSIAALYLSQDKLMRSYQNAPLLLTLASIASVVIAATFVTAFAYNHGKSNREPGAQLITHETSVTQLGAQQPPVHYAA